VAFSLSVFPQAVRHAILDRRLAEVKKGGREQFLLFQVFQYLINNPMALL
jgi:hypothetical protein